MEENVLNYTITIYNDLLTPPRIIFPTIGEIIINHSYRISWERAIDTANHAIKYSVRIFNESSSFLLVSDLNENNYLWNITNLLDGPYVVEVMAMCTGGKNSTDQVSIILDLVQEGPPLPFELLLILGGIAFGSLTVGVVAIGSIFLLRRRIGFLEGRLYRKEEIVKEYAEKASKVMESLKEDT